MSTKNESNHLNFVAFDTTSSKDLLNVNQTFFVNKGEPFETSIPEYSYQIYCENGKDIYIILQFFDKSHKINITRLTVEKLSLEG